MLLNLHVKNLALVEEAEIEFGEGLNILTGETGAGKSVILGSINLALGAKAGPDIIGRYGDSALVELTFSVNDEDKTTKFEEMDIFPEDGIVTVSRRILPGRSIIKVNGETVTAGLVKKITELLIDIHGQHEHQSLLYPAKHLEILDKYARDELKEPKEKLQTLFSSYKKSVKELDSFTVSDDERKRECDFLQFEIDEIDSAALTEGEDEKVESLYRKMSNGQKIIEELNQAGRLTGALNGDGASDAVARAYSAVNSVIRYDEGLTPLLNQLADIDSMMSDFNRELSDYMEDLDFEQSEFLETEKRLDLINNLKSKYGATIELIFEHRNKAADKLKFYSEYEDNYRKAKEKSEQLYKEIIDTCEIISQIRKTSAQKLQDKIKTALLDLNFEQVQFKIDVRNAKSLQQDGYDEAEFLISVNPGEEVKPLAKIASGGELSRIMLGIKAVLANKDETDTLIFDEIDTGISGRTAQKVSEKMMVISKTHQVICITHLPQIAAMADNHFLIEKNIDDGFTKTFIKPIYKEQITKELGRMLGGTEITEAVMLNAAEMKQFANDMKKH